MIRSVKLNICKNPELGIQVSLFYIYTLIYIYSMTHTQEEEVEGECQWTQCLMIHTAVWQQHRLPTHQAAVTHMRCSPTQAMQITRRPLLAGQRAVTQTIN